MSVTGLNTRGAPNSLTGLESISNSISSKFVPYTGAIGPVNLGSQKITTTYSASSAFDLVNLQVLTNAITYVDNANALTYLNKVTSNAQSVQGDVEFKSNMKLSNLTASTVPYLDSTKTLQSSVVTSTELGYVSGVTSSIQTQLNTKASITYVDTQDGLRVLKAGDTMTGTLFNSGGNFHAYRGGDLNRACILYANNADGATYATHNGGLASWYGIGFYCTNDSTARFIFNTRTGDSSQTGTLTANAVNVDGQTASRVCVLDASKNIVSSSVTSTTLGYLDATSSIQTQLNAKANLAGPQTFTGSQTASGVWEFNNATPLWLSHPNFIGPRLLGIGLNGYVTRTNVSLTEASYLQGVTSAIQTQIDSKASTTYVNTQDGLRVLKAGDTMTGALTVDVSNGYASRASNPLSSNIIASSSSQRLYMGSYYTLSVGACATIQSSDFYSSADHGTSLLLNPLGGTVGIGTSTPGSYAFHVEGTSYLNGDTTISGNVGIGTAAKTGVQLKLADGIQNRKIVLYDGAFTDDFQYYGLGINANTLRFNVPKASTDRFSFFAGTSSTAATEVFRINGTGELNSGVAGANANITPNLKMASSASHIDNNAGEVYLFTAYSGHLAIGQNTTRNATTTNLVLGVGGTEEGEIISVNTNNTAYKPMSFASSKYNFTNGNVFIAKEYNLHVCNGNNTNETTRSQITMGWYGSSHQYRHVIKTEHNGGAGPTSNDNSMSFYLWSNADGVDSLGTNLKLSVAGGGVGINVADPSAQLHMVSTTANYTNCCILKADGGAAVNLDSTGGSGRNYSLISTVAGYGIGSGCFGIYDITNSVYRLGINTSGWLAVNPNGTDFLAVMSVFWTTGQDYFTLHNSNFTEGTYINQRFLFGSTTGTNRSAYIQAYKINNEARLKFFVSDSSGGVNERCVVRDNGIDVTGNAIISGNVSAATYSAVNATVNTYQNTSNRLLFRDGSGALTVGSCSFWRYTNDSIAWTYGVAVANAFYVPSTTATIIIHITGSGYAWAVDATRFYVNAYTGSTNYIVSQRFFFNQTYVHTQMTQHIVIPPNSWGASTIGYKDISVSWNYSLGFVDSDGNDTLQFCVEVIG